MDRVMDAQYLAVVQADDTASLQEKESQQPVHSPRHPQHLIPRRRATCFSYLVPHTPFSIFLVSIVLHAFLVAVHAALVALDQTPHYVNANDATELFLTSVPIAIFKVSIPLSCSSPSRGSDRYDW